VSSIVSESSGGKSHLEVARSTLVDDNKIAPAAIYISFVSIHVDSTGKQHVSWLVSSSMPLEVLSETPLAVFNFDISDAATTPSN
jgi:hypothetical protein